MNEPPENKYVFRDNDCDVGSFIFMGPGPGPGQAHLGKEIARIDLRDGTVTYEVPDAGREAAKIFWEQFSDYIKEQIRKEREK